MTQNVKQRERKGTKAGQPKEAAGRAAQRNRTRKAIVDATMKLMAAGRTPSMAEIIEAAQVSRRTIYMYFPTLEQLLLDATMGALTTDSVDAVLAATETQDAATRAERLSREVTRLSGNTMHLGRALIRLTVEGNEPSAGAPRRGFRRVEWIERALKPARGKLTRREYERLVSTLAVLIGWEALIVLQDVRGLDTKETENVLASAVRTIVEAALEGR